MVQLIRPRRRDGLRRGYSVGCQAVRLDGFRRIGGRLLDLSHRGALLECNGAVSVGDEVVVSFDFRVADRVVDAVAEVCRVTRHDFGARAGLRFTEMDWEDRAALYVGLIGVPPRLPSRRPMVDYAATVRRIAQPWPAPSLHAAS
jgi:hypothetical protein